MLLNSVCLRLFTFVYEAARPASVCLCLFSKRKERAKASPFGSWFTITITRGHPAGGGTAVRDARRAGWVGQRGRQSAGEGERLQVGGRGAAQWDHGTAGRGPVVYLLASYD